MTAYDLAPGEDSEPEPLEAWQLTDETCPRLRCSLPATTGTHQWRNRGPNQLLHRRTYHCPNSHTWTRETDGG